MPPAGRIYGLWVCLLLIAGAGCSDRAAKAPAPAENEQAEAERNARLAESRKQALRALPREVSYPADNPYTPAKAALGKLLFFDPILSGGRDVACATCHHPSMGYAEFRDLPIGVNGTGLGRKRAFNEPNNIPFTKRNSPTVLNAAFNGLDNSNKYIPEQAPMFWDLRVKSLELQALKPIHALEEMRGHRFSEKQIAGEIENRLKGIPEYLRRFSEVFPGPEPVTIMNTVRAIATFERQLVTQHTRFDAYKRGDYKALSLSEKEGMETFIRVGCAKCHNGPMLSDYETHVLGVPHSDKLPEPDLGQDDTNAFRTPTLRNLRFTAPYMHNGAFATLEKVLEFYEDIAIKNTLILSVDYEDLDSRAKELTIKTQDIQSIVAFLNALNSEDFDQAIPASVPSGLPVGGNIRN